MPLHPFPQVKSIKIGSMSTILEYSNKWTKKCVEGYFLEKYPHTSQGDKVRFKFPLIIRLHSFKIP
jgi:hypothetical protein